MDSRVLAAVAQGDGLVTVRDLHLLGIEPRQVARWLKAQQLQQVRRGVYTTRDLWETWDEYYDRPLARIRAARRTLRLPFVFSHDSAAIPQRIPLIRPQDADVHITRTHLRGSRTSSGIHHHGARYQPGEVVEVAGLFLLAPARTAVDIAREHGYRAGLVAADGAMQLGVTRTQLHDAAGAMVGWPHSLVVKSAIADADPGAESPSETLGRELLHECGFEQVETQFPVNTPSGVRWTDLRVGRHVFEVEGRKKSKPVADGGLADRDLEQILWDQRKRQREVCAQGLGMSQIVWADYWGRARERAKLRLRQEYAVTEHRFGTDLTAQQAEFAARMRGRRYRSSG
ncbi:MAG: type IV toxin-antitoxin system AbiEi family antitoxin domain-containing protein [Nocardioides sp.]